MNKILLTLSALAALPVLGFADDTTTGGGTTPPVRPPRPIPDALKAWDTNNDGVLSADEIKAGREAARAAFIAKWDTDKDGKLSRDELKAAFEAWKAEHPKPTTPPTTGDGTHPPRPPKPKPPGTRPPRPTEPKPPVPPTDPATPPA